MTDRLDRITRDTLARKPISREDAEYLADGPVDTYDLMHRAGTIRRAFLGNVVTTCAIVSAKTGGCSEDCRFCSQSSRYHTDVAAHRFLPADAIRDAAQTARDIGAGGLGVVTSGRGVFSERDTDAICDALKTVSDTGVSAHASVGIVPDEATVLKMIDAGLECAHMNLETSKRFYPEICTTHSWEERYDTLRLYKRAGLPVCSGGLFGLGETWADRVDLALTLRKLNVDKVPLNFLHRIPGTPMEHVAPLTPLECLRIIALYRFVLPEKGISVCGGREVNLRDMQGCIFLAGASGLMIGNYLTTSGRDVAADMRMIQDAGMRVQNESCGNLSAADNTPNTDRVDSAGVAGTVSGRSFEK